MIDGDVEALSKYDTLYDTLILSLQVHCKVLCTD